MNDEDWTRYDAVNVLALALFRIYRGPEAVYSNGTEHEIAVEDAENLLKRAPVLERVLVAGIRSLGDELDAYTMAMAAGDRAEIVAFERNLVA